MGMEANVLAISVKWQGIPLILGVLDTTVHLMATLTIQEVTLSKLKAVSPSESPALSFCVTPCLALRQ